MINRITVAVFCVVFALSLCSCSDSRCITPGNTSDTWSISSEDVMPEAESINEDTAYSVVQDMAKQLKTQCLNVDEYDIEYVEKVLSYLGQFNRNGTDIDRHIACVYDVYNGIYNFYLQNETNELFKKTLDAYYENYNSLPKLSKYGFGKLNRARLEQFASLAQEYGKAELENSKSSAV